MLFQEIPLKGAYIVDLDFKKDERGFFARSYCWDEFEQNGLNPCIVQCNISFNLKKGTVRGMHFQRKPKPEPKLVRCDQGSIYDVIIDLRYNSPTYCQWFGMELDSRSYRSIYIPDGFAHGFQTLEDNSQVFYQMGERYAPEYASGVRWNDNAFSIVWPLPVTCISSKDNSYPNFIPENLY
ncbi:dTDP-4-dehydrorhamnose 3,5-epimerase [Spirulina sp. CS-785/01]|uniref:dTDP-4-dehydrorhamnose 3,5-epimerase n=1 Tax=Spirulina sp. CS-785/01 TaxID=3021716 RepID=UPI00232D6DE0|nr:dTDP-4-dehydrorhamnose 3,5-epimerase [Spirulina sp. CS-785/01]MDB9313052.1 dTDP-4-dehydrorhamnose 3,5-epimerase [Spirulina sp. CS-785/01]